MAKSTKDKLLFLTGELAEARLKSAIANSGLQAGSWRIANIGIKVAALMTEKIVRNRLKAPLEATRVVVPGRARMDLKSLAEHYGVPFERGPDEIADCRSTSVTAARHRISRNMIFGFSPSWSMLRN